MGFCTDFLQESRDIVDVRRRHDVLATAAGGPTYFKLESLQAELDLERFRA